MFTRTGVVATGVAVILAMAVPQVAATPVATTEEEAELYGRVFLEPLSSVDFIQYSDEFAPGMQLLEKMYPRYMTFTSIDKELNDPRAVSGGRDAIPAWHEDDSGDGLPFHLAIVTDESVPDRKKEYVFLTNAHAAEPCGREGDIRYLEDLLIWRTTDPDHEVDAATGLTGKEQKVTVRELLERTKIYFVDTVPDPWEAGDRVNGGNANYSNGNYAGFNTNRVAFHDGWVFPDEESLFRNGYTTLTQPESAIVKYFERVRRNELKGRPFAAAADMHGPLPVGAVLLHEQNNSPTKLVRIHDFAERIKQKMEETLGEYITPQGVTVYELLMDAAGDVRDEVLHAYNQFIGPFSEKAGYITLEWAEYATIWDHLDYTVSGTWGGWAAADAGLGADSISYEVNCASYAPYDGRSQQIYVDNMRAIIETTVVHAATMDTDLPKPKLDTKIGFYESGDRITDKDGNPSPPPRGPRNPVYGPTKQIPYDVSNTDYFRDLRDLVPASIKEVRSNQLDTALGRLDSFVIADRTVDDDAALNDFVNSGGTLVLTDSALQMLPNLAGVDGKAIVQDYAYVGYSDLDREHPWTEGLYDRARQTYDPVGLGYPLLMERDQYWPCDPQGDCDPSPTKNSSPIWSVDRAAWEDAGGTTIGTVDPPSDRKGGAEGTATTKTSIGVLEQGDGRIIIFGALLPQPSEDYEHWFGLNSYTITIAGQDLFLKALGAE